MFALVAKRTFSLELLDTTGVCRWPPDYGKRVEINRHYEADEWFSDWGGDRFNRIKVGRKIKYQ